LKPILVRLIPALALTIALATNLPAQQPWTPPSFTTQTITVSDGVNIYVRTGGSGPVVVLLHGYGETGDMWTPLAAELAKTHTVIVPDLRGMGLSSRPATGYDKRTEAGDIRAVVTKLGFDRTAVVGHDIGNMVAYAYAAKYPSKVERLVVMDAPIPGIEPWEQLLRNPLLWHFSFGGPDAERLVQGRERIYLDRFWNEFAAHPERFTEEERAHYAALYAAPGAMRAGFAQFAAFSQDAEDNKGYREAKLTMPVLAVGGEKSFGKMMGIIMRNAATNVQEAVVPDAGHWLMEENPGFTVPLIVEFLGAAQRSAADRRITPSEFSFAGGGAASATGTADSAGTQLTVLKGDPNHAGLYTIMLKVPAHTRIAAHFHPDERVATVVSGTWYFGYGDAFDAGALKALPPGSFYTEPAGRTHFAETRDKPVIVQISGVGPSGTEFVAVVPATSKPK
jgi:pimeloyl-ACP methyl ester carboxylesterase/quercetin dioxygenase-like cupin family protein